MAKQISDYVPICILMKHMACLVLVLQNYLYCRSFVVHLLFDDCCWNHGGCFVGNRCSFLAQIIQSNGLGCHQCANDTQLNSTPEHLDGVLQAIV